MSANIKNDLITWSPKPNQTKTNIIEWLYLRPDFPIIIKKMVKDKYLAEELTSELFLHLCKHPDEQIIDYYERQVIDYVIIHFLDKQFKSENSPFYKIKRGAFPKELISKAYDILHPDTNSEIKDSYDTALRKAIQQLKSPGEYKEYHSKIMLEYLKQEYSIKDTAKKLRIRPEYISIVIKDAKIMLEPLITKEIQDYLNSKIQ